MPRSLTMNIAVVFLLFFAALMLGSCAKETEKGGVPAGGIKWVTSMDEALQQAAKKNRPIMIDVYADWCGWCKRLDSDTYSNKDVIAKSGEFVDLKLDADANKDIVNQYKIGGLPTILFLDSQGHEIHKVIGYKPPNQFVVEMDKALSTFKNERG
jgi:thiol:disulfide interchange protein